MLGSGGIGRPIRFGVVGIITFGVQLSVFYLLKSAGLPGLVANAVAIPVAVQFNFAANQLFVWRDVPVRLFSRALIDRWATFHACIAVSLAVNYAVFAAAQFFIPEFLAFMVGIGSSTAIKFVSLDRFAFRASNPT